MGEQVFLTKDGRSRTILGGLLLLVLLLSQRPAWALPPELEYAKGVVAFSQGNLKQAREHFSAVLAADPSNLEAIYYQGQVALGLGQSQQAVRLFSKVRELDPSNSAVQLDLALALVKAQRMVEAERELVAALAVDPTRSAVHYYLGFCRYKLGRYRDALAPLEQARRLDGGFASSAGYYLGLAYHAIGEQDRALEQFEQLAGEGGADDRIGSLARENLAVLAGVRQGSRSGRWWGAYASAGFGYDSNITLDAADFGRGAAPGSFLSLGGYLLPLRGKRDGLELAVNVYRSFNFSDETWDLNLTDVAALARYRHTFSSGHALELGYLFDLDMLDDLSRLGGDSGFGVFMHGHTVQGRLRLREGRFSATSLVYRFRWQQFDDWMRTNFGHEVVLRQDLGLLAGRLRLALELGGQYEDARERNWNLWGLQAALECRTQLYGPLSGWLKLAWLREDHKDFILSGLDGRRIDDLWSGGAGLSLQISDNVSLSASYMYLNNDSNGLSGLGHDRFRYTRHLVTGAVLGRM